jgi:hypothetical protein
MSDHLTLIVVILAVSIGTYLYYSRPETPKLTWPLDKSYDYVIGKYIDFDRPYFFHTLCTNITGH